MTAFVDSSKKAASTDVALLRRMLAELHHELGTPLTALANALALRDRLAAHLPADAQDADAQAAAARLGDLLKDFRAAHRVLNAEPASLGDVREAVQMAVESFETRVDQTVTCRLAPAPEIAFHSAAVGLLVERLLTHLHQQPGVRLFVETGGAGAGAFVRIAAEGGDADACPSSGNLFLPSFIALLHRAVLDEEGAAGGKAFKLTFSGPATEASGTTPMGAESLSVMGDTRFDRHWAEWKTAGSGGLARDFLSSARLDELVELLASEQAANAPYDRNVIATALLNRVAPDDDELMEARIERFVLEARRRRYESRTLVRDSMARVADSRALLNLARTTRRFEMKARR